jgi:hypothetical protein
VTSGAEAPLNLCDRSTVGGCDVPLPCSL